MISPDMLEKIALNCATLTAQKNRSYGDSFAKSGEILKILMPSGCPPEKFQDMLTVARIIDKLFRICTEKSAFQEDPWRDILGYALLMCASERAAHTELYKQMRDELSPSTRAHEIPRTHPQPIDKTTL